MPAPRSRPLKAPLPLALLLAALALMSTVGTLFAPAADASPTWTLSQEYPGPFAGLAGIACPTASVCFAAASDPSLILKTTDGGSTWAKGPAEPAGGGLSAIACANTSDCWATGSSGPGPGGDSWEPLIMATTDGGATWVTQQAPSGSGYITAVACPSTNDCWALGGNGSPASIINTTDGGSVWATQDTPAGVPTLSGVACTSTLDCIVVGEATSSSGIILTTTNGGASWASDTDGNALPVLLTVSCAGGSDCWAAGYTNGTGAVIVSTTDGGAQWVPESPPAGDDWVLNSISCGSATSCVAVGGYDFSPALFVTSNGGATWTEPALPSVVGGILDGVSCSSADNCLATGAEPGTSGPAVFLSSTNGGTTWTATPPGPSTTLTGDACPTAQECWVYGSQEAAFVPSPAVFETVDTGASWQAVTNLPTGITSVTGLTCASATECFLGASLSASPYSEVLVTTNGGGSWSTQASPDFPTVCPTTEVCFAISPSQGVAATANAGQSWQNQSLQPINGYRLTVMSLACANASDCWAAGLWEDEASQNPTEGPFVEATTNGGTTWSAQVVPSGFEGQEVNAISCPTASACMATSAQSSNDVLVTKDGGADWASEALPSPLVNLDQLVCTTPSSCWVSALADENSSEFNNIWLLTLTGGAITATAQVLPAGVSSPGDLSCATSSNCMAVGATQDGEEAILFMNDSGGGGSTTTGAPGAPGGGAPPAPTTTSTVPARATSSSSLPTTSTVTTSTAAVAPLPPGAPSGTYGPPVTATVGPGGVRLTGSADGAQALVSVPNGALPAGTVVALAPVKIPSKLESEVPAGQSYLASFSVSWVAPDGGSPTASGPITMTIIDPKVRAGDTVYVLTSHGLKAVGKATTNGRVTVTFTSDPAFLLAAVPKLSLASSRAVLRSNTVQVRLMCRSGPACSGTALVTLNAGRTALAQKRFSIGAGRTAVLKMADTAAGKRFLASHPSRPLTGSLTVKVLGGPPGKYRVTLR